MSAPSKRIAPALGWQEPGERVVERGLAGAVAAEHRDDLAGADGEVDAAQHRQRAVAGGADRGTSSMRASRPQPRGGAVAEIGLDHRGIGDDRGGRPSAMMRAVGQHVDVLGQAHHRLHDVLDQQQRHAVVADARGSAATISAISVRVEARPSPRRAAAAAAASRARGPAPAACVRRR